MNSHYRTGRDREYKVRDDLIARGYRFVLRASGSKGSADILMARPGASLWVQVGSASKTLGPAARARIVDDADAFGAIPVLAVVKPRQPVLYCEVVPDGLRPLHVRVLA